MQRNSSSTQKVLVKRDFANAFNCVSLEVALREVAARFLGLAHYLVLPDAQQLAVWFLRFGVRLDSSLRFGSSRLECSKATLWVPCFLLQPSTHWPRTLRGQGLDLAIHYLDDGVLAGDWGAVAAA